MSKKPRRHTTEDELMAFLVEHGPRVSIKKIREAGLYLDPMKSLVAAGKARYEGRDASTKRATIISISQYPKDICYGITREFRVTQKGERSFHIMQRQSPANKWITLGISDAQKPREAIVNMEDAQKAFVQTILYWQKGQNNGSHG